MNEKNKKRMAQLLVETGAYTDLDKPVILTSGELGIYYVNTEKLVQDGGEFEIHGKDSKAMIDHAMKMMEIHPTFREAIEIIANEVKPYTLDQNFPQICGGQRRDWLFSGPVAQVLELPHISLYKDPSKQPTRGYELLTSSGTRIPAKFCANLEEAKAVHIVDMITEASSCCKEPNGWVPQLRKGGADITDLFAVTTRLQGGEENLAKMGVDAHTFVEINEDFLKQYSKNPERALAYQQDPRAWSESYLRSEGALALLKTFNPNGGKLDRTKKFLSRYEEILRDSGKYEELKLATSQNYGLDISQLTSA